jgi:GNAT superfamily N-acetyltransferase
MRETSQAQALHDGTVVTEVVAHTALSEKDVEALRSLFDEEYFQDFGPWDPDQPYGYAPHDVHVIARSADSVVGHVGWARRVIDVGDEQVAIAGVGGVLISGEARGQGQGGVIMTRAAEAMADAGDIDFGYLGCREEVVPFYSSCGWHRISAGERSIGRDGSSAEDEPGQPLMILPLGTAPANWPSGVIDLNGRAW